MTLRLALPSDGELHEPTLTFLRDCGLRVTRPSTRRYTGTLAAVPGTGVLFQRSGDITSKVEEGSAELGIVGLDRYLELCREGTDAVVLMDDLGFGRCELVLAVPEEWLDVTSIADLADVAVDCQEKGQPLRVATKYPRLVERFLHAKDVTAFTLVRSSGTLEAAPAMGYADVIGDITSSGATLRENGLKRLAGGTVMASQACLIANKALLRGNSELLERTRLVLERLEARLWADRLCAVRGVLHGSAREGVLAQLSELQESLGVELLTTHPASSGCADGVDVTVLLERAHLQRVADLLRQGGASRVTVSQPEYVFQGQCQAYRRLLQYLQGAERA